MARGSHRFSRSRLLRAGASFSLHVMRTLKPCLLIAVVLVGVASSVAAASPKVAKVLPQFLDREGRHALSPSLYDRDAYQAQLRLYPEQRSGIRFACTVEGCPVQAFKLRVEMRGNRVGQPTTSVLEETVRRRGFFSSWSNPALTGDAYKQFGELIAWRVTLWDDEMMVAEQKSFLW